MYSALSVKWVLRNYTLYAKSIRTFSRSAIRLKDDATRLSAMHRVNTLEKRFLVWTGKFKKVEDVPTYVSQEMVDKARNRMRIRIANIMMVLTAVASIVILYSSKQAHKRGESVAKQNLDWHRQYDESHRQYEDSQNKKSS